MNGIESFHQKSPWNLFNQDPFNSPSPAWMSRIYKDYQTRICKFREGPSGDLQSFTDTGQSYFSFILIIDTIQMK